MDVQHDPCSRQAIEQFLADRLSEEEQGALEDHLECCPACRQRLDDVAAEGSWWQEARGYLSSADAPPDDEAPASLCGLQGYLGPTDDPHALGRLGGYEIIGIVGSGGMGIVLKAFDAPLNRYVAIKVLGPQLALSGAARQRFAREAKAAAAVVHDNVMAIHAVAEANGLPYFVMPYVRGPSLEKRLRQSGALAVVEVLRIGLQIASGLAAAHRQGLVHRDVKPANILLEEGVERVTLTDFGLARAVDDASLTRTGVIAGTPQYMSPEQAGGKPVDHRSDLFSLGSVLYAMCTGRPPFRADTTLGVLRRVEEDRPPSVRAVNPDVPEWLARVVEKLHAKDPADRFQNAAEVAALLEGYLAHLRQPATVPAPPLPPAPRRPSPRRRLALAALAAVALFGGLVSLYMLLGDPPAPAPEFYQDFRGGRIRYPDLKMAGLDGSEEIVPDDRGLRIKLPATRKLKDPAGVALFVPVRGNFEVTAGYELVGTDRPKTGQGTGVELYVMTNAPTEEALAFGRVRHTDGREVFWCSHNFTGGGRRRFDVKEVPAAGTTGRLRLERMGREIICRSADGTGGDFREVARFGFGTEDLKMVRVGAYPGQSTEPVDVRLVDLKVHAELSATEPTAGPADAAAAPKVARRGWLTAAGIVLLAIALALLGVWGYGRRSRRAPQAKAATAPLIAVVCTGCGQTLKAKAELAGLKAKCVRCGQVVLVPAQ